MKNYRTEIFPASRIATKDVGALGNRKHHVVALLEMDVTHSRVMIRQLKNEKVRVSFTAWLIKVFACTVKEYSQVAAFMRGKRHLVIFDHINVSLLVEKKLGESRVPIPVIIEKANEKNLETITAEIEEAKKQTLTGEDIVLKRKTRRMERIYYILPGFLRMGFWRILLRLPVSTYRNMGNVAVTSIGMMGRGSGWFIPFSIHPVCFGIGKVNKKPLVVNEKIEVGEMLNLTILMDHDVADGGIMARFISTLTKNIENGKYILK